jgi:flagellar hook assembly protein FlgD
MDAKISINIYTISGRKVKSMIERDHKLGFNRISWNGRDEYGNLLANGVYLYKLKAEINDQIINHIGRLAIYR